MNIFTKDLTNDEIFIGAICGVAGVLSVVVGTFIGAAILG